MNEDSLCINRDGKEQLRILMGLEIITEAKDEWSRVVHKKHRSFTFKGSETRADDFSNYEQDTLVSTYLPNPRRKGLHFHCPYMSCV